MRPAAISWKWQLRLLLVFLDSVLVSSGTEQPVASFLRKRSPQLQEFPGM
jgi:hypothetical protein